MNEIIFHFAIVFLQLVVGQKNTEGLKKKAKADTSSIQRRTFSDMLCVDKIYVSIHEICIVEMHRNDGKVRKHCV